MIIHQGSHQFTTLYPDQGEASPQIHSFTSQPTGSSTPEGDSGVVAMISVQEFWSLESLEQVWFLFKAQTARQCSYWGHPFAKLSLGVKPCVKTMARTMASAPAVVPGSPGCCQRKARWRRAPRHLRHRCGTQITREMPRRNTNVTMMTNDDVDHDDSDNGD